MRYLLDTNIVSDLVRNPQGKVATHVRKVGEDHVCTSIIVAAELRYEANKKGSPRLSSQLEAVLGALEVLPFETSADANYGLLRTRLEQAGTPIGAERPADCGPSPSAWLRDRHRQRKRILRVKGLRVQNWLRSAE